jgi:hypothetical protein
MNDKISKKYRALFLRREASLLWFVATSNLCFFVAMISKTEHQKISVQMGDESIMIELIPSVFNSLLEASVS